MPPKFVEEEEEEEEEIGRPRIINDINNSGIAFLSHTTKKMFCWHAASESQSRPTKTVFFNTHFEKDSYKMQKKTREASIKCRNLPFP